MSSPIAEASGTKISEYAPEQSGEAIAVPLPNNFEELIDYVTPKGRFISSGAIVNIFFVRQIWPHYFHELQNTIVGHRTMRKAVAGAYVIANKKETLFYALGGNYRTLIARAMLGPVYVSVIPWELLEHVCRVTGTVPKDYSFMLNDDIIRSLIGPMRRLEEGQHGKSIVDHSQMFRKVVNNNWKENERCTMKYNAPRGKLTITLTEWFKKVWKIELKASDENSFLYHVGGAVPGSKKIDDDNILAELWNNNGKISAARHVLIGYRHLYDNPDIEPILRGFKVPIKLTGQIIEKLGHLTHAQMDNWVQGLKLIKPEDRIGSSYVIECRAKSKRVQSTFVLDKEDELYSILVCCKVKKIDQARKAIKAYVRAQIQNADMEDYETDTEKETRQS